MEITGGTVEVAATAGALAHAKSMKDVKGIKMTVMLLLVVVVVEVTGTMVVV